MKKAIIYILGSVAIIATCYVLYKLYIVFFIVSRFFPSFDTSKPLTLHTFYRLQVSLTHKPDNKPVEIDMMLGCGSKNRQVLGEGVTSIGIRVPNIYGIKLESGEGVLVQTPDLCSRGSNIDMIPDDFMPLVLYAPDGDDLEFMIAHVSTISYDQEFSKLLFHKATVENVTKEDIEVWQENGEKNIIETRLTSNDFYEGIFSQYYPPEDDIRYAVNQISCKSVIRVPILEEMKPLIRQWWPADKPRFWMPDSGQEGVKEYGNFIRKAFKERGSDSETLRLLGRDNDKEYLGEVGSFGIYNPNGQGGIIKGESRYSGSSQYFGEALRIPYRTNTGYPWISQEAKDKKYRPRVEGVSSRIKRAPAEKIYTPPPPSYEYHMDTQLGADQGFAYCYRELKRRFIDPEIAFDSKKRTPIIHNYPRKVFIDGKLEIFIQNRRPKTWIEEDKYFLKKSNLTLHSGGARQDVR